MRSQQRSKDDVAARLPRLLRPPRMARPIHLAAVGVSLLLVWSIVYAAGGTHTAWPHLFYFPILLAAVTLGVPGGVVTAGLAAVACGPFMPLEVATGTTQSLDNWLTRGAFFLGVGTLTGTTIASFRRSLEDSLSSFLEREVTSAAAQPSQSDPAMTARLGRTIEEGRFHPVFQPIYSLRTGQLLAVEALTRFDGDPPLPPNVLFEHASRTGMEAELDLVTARAALLAAEEQLPTDITLHINVTPTSLRDERLLHLLTAFPHRNIVVELTEHAVIDNYQSLELPCRRLRNQGVKLAVDDAGAGIASLRHVVKLAPEIIKLDMSLTRDVRKDPVQDALATALTQFASRIGAQLIVEGIEEVADLTAWTRIGADAAQGYLLGRPGPLPHPLQHEHRPALTALARLAGTG